MGRLPVELSLRPSEGSASNWTVSAAATPRGAGLCISLVLLLTACAEAPKHPLIVENPFAGKWQEAVPAPARLVLEQVYGGDGEGEGEVLEGPSFASADPLGDLYLVDDERLIAFRPDGTTRWSVASRGEGPGELRLVGGLAVTEDAIWITNQLGTRIDRFDLDGRVGNSRSLAGLGIRWAALGGVLENGNLVIATRLRGRIGNRVRVISAAGAPTIIDSLTVDRTGAIEVLENLSLGGEVSVVGDAIAVSLVDKFGYAFFSPVLDTLRVVLRRDVPYKPPYPFVLNGNSGVLSSGRLDPARSLADGRWLAGGAWSKDPRSPERRAEAIIAGDPSPLELEESVDLYDRDGTLLYSWGAEALEGVGIAGVLATDGESRIYARTKDLVPTVGRYRLELSQEAGRADR